MIEIGTPDDQSAVKVAFAINGTLHAIKEMGIYEIKLADNTDPDRLNPAVPNTQQRVLEIGSDSELVGRTLLTAQRLFNKSYLPNFVDTDKCLSETFAILKSLHEMQRISDALMVSEKKAADSFEGQRRKDGSLLMPSIGDIPARFKAFIQNADYALVLVLNIVKLFYGNDAGKRWFESFSELVSAQNGKDDEFAKYLNETLPFLKFVRATRNCIEHPKEAERVVINDFSLGPDAKLYLPQVEVIHPKNHQELISTSVFMVQMTDHLVSVVETMIAFMCSKNIKSPAGFPIQVVEIPENQRQTEHVRYSYGFYDGDRVVLAS